MDSSKQSNIKQEIYSVKDPLSQFAIILLMAIVAIFTLIMVKVTISQKTIQDVVASICAIVFLVGIMLLMFYRLKAIWKGVELNLSTRTMSFPGGGIAANDITDYFKPGFLFQIFKRKTIDLDAISEIQKETIQKTTYSREKGTRVDYTHYIKFVGSFGAAHVRFANEGKCDELYNIIRMANRMGTPVFAT